ncbi:MAG: alpha/beta hydrolase [Pseudomonadota bacterium]
MSTKVFHLGSEERFLLGTLHYSPRMRRPSAAVLLCNPFGEEAVRAHRVFRVLATQLERAGYPTMRFDFFGTGDSAGLAEEAGVSQWLQDIEMVASELQRLSGAKHIALVGLRFGATLAARVTHANGLRPLHLVLWDPVVEGAAYLRELAAAHGNYMREELGQLLWHGVEVDARGAPSESLGTPISSQLAAEIAASDLDAGRIHANFITVINTRDSPQMQALRVQLASVPGLHWSNLVTSDTWNSDSALNNATVPVEVIDAIVGRIAELSP